MEHHTLTASMSITGDAFPDTTTSALDDGFISGSNVNVLVTGSGHTKVGAPPGTPQPVVVETKVVILPSVSVTRTPPPGFPDFCSPAGIRFSSLYFQHGTTRTISGHVKFEIGQDTITVHVDLLVGVYNRSIAWVDGDPYPESDPLGIVADYWSDLANLLSSSMQNAGYQCFSNPADTLTKAQVLSAVPSSTSLTVVAHGSNTTLSTCAGQGQTTEIVTSGEIAQAWTQPAITPMSHFSIVFACQTIVSSNEQKSAAFASAIMTRPNGAYVGFTNSPTYTVAGKTMADLATFTFSYLADGYTLQSAIEKAKVECPGFALDFVGDPLTTLQHVYLTAAERAEHGHEGRYASWYFIIPEQQP